MNIVNKVIQSRRKTKNQPWMKDRLKHCLACPHNTKNSGKSTILLRTIKWLADALSKVMRYKTEDLGQCGICTCTIAEMVKIPNQTCSMIFLNEEPKWTEQKKN